MNGFDGAPPDPTPTASKPARMGEHAITTTSRFETSFCAGHDSYLPYGSKASIRT
jgi:hypothetical protein